MNCRSFSMCCAGRAAGARVAETLEQGVVVTVFPDGAGRYLGERFWEEGE